MPLLPSIFKASFYYYCLYYFPIIEAIITSASALLNTSTIETVSISSNPSATGTKTLFLSTF
jgi:hypothetical protein